MGVSPSPGQLTAMNRNVRLLRIYVTSLMLTPFLAVWVALHLRELPREADQA